jgi:cytochrome b561
MMSSPTNALSDNPRRGTVDYNAVAKSLHWIAVALLLVEFPLGWLMPPTGRDEVPAASVNLHFSIGMLILVVFAVRYTWRLVHPVPMEASLPDWQKRLAQTAHWLLYVLVFSTLLAGWAHASVRGWPITMFGWFSVPPICAKDSETGHFFGTLHQPLSVMFVSLIGLHVAGVMYHHFIQRDRILERMLPQDMGG